MQLENQNYDQQVEMCETLLHHDENYPQTLNNIFSGEAFLHLSGRVNCHNTEMWGMENPVAIIKHKSDTTKLVVWCAISMTGLIRPYFLRDGNGKTVNVHGDNYHQMLQDYAFP